MEMGGESVEEGDGLKVVARLPADCPSREKKKKLSAEASCRNEARSLQHVQRISAHCSSPSMQHE